MKARVLDPQVKVYSTMDADSISIATLTAGNEIEFGGAKRRGGKVWVPVTLSTGQQAFIPGETRIYVIQLGSLLQDNVDVHADPNSESLVKLHLARKTKVHILQVIKAGGKEWVKIRDMSGNEGYIAGNTRIRVIQQNTKAIGMKNLRSGVMWLIAGLIITFSGNTSTPGSFYGLFGYIALLFGVIMLVLGFIQYRKAPA